MTENKIIEGVPESISRQQYLAMIEAVGFNVKKLRTLEFRADGVYATIKASGPDGRDVLERNEIAEHKVYVPVVDEPDAS